MSLWSTLRPSTPPPLPDNAVWVHFGQEGIERIPVRKVLSGEARPTLEDEARVPLNGEDVILLSGESVLPVIDEEPTTLQVSRRLRREKMEEAPL